MAKNVLRENDYGQIPLLANSMSYNYLYILVLTTCTLLCSLPKSIICKFSVPADITIELFPSDISKLSATRNVKF